MLVVFHHGALGDFVLALSVIQAARRATGSASVVAVATASSAAVAAGRSAVDERLSPEQVGLHTLFSEGGPLDGRLENLLGQAQLVLSFLGGPELPVHQRLRAATAARLVAVDPVPTSRTLQEGVHITHQWAQAIREAGLSLPDPSAAEIHLPISRPPRQAADRRSRVIIHPGSGGRAKCRPLADFLALADAMTDVEITWMLGPAECEPGDERFETLRHRGHGGRECLLAAPDLQEAAERIAAADLYLGNDSGMTHLAAALGVPTVAVFVMSDPRIWRPLGQHVHVISGESIDLGQLGDLLTPRRWHR